MSLNNFFNPRSIAVIGASRHREKVGNVIFRNLLKNEEVKVFPININAERVEGIRAYKSILDVKEKVDLAVIAIPAKFVPRVMEEIVKKGVEACLIISAGFSEVGKEGEKLEREISRIARRGKVRIVGPNSLGIINVSKNLNITFFEGEIRKGGIAFFSQSGALGVGILDSSKIRNIGLSLFCSVGNMVDVSFPELIEFANSHEGTKVISLYVEALKKGRKFLKACKDSGKKVIFLKGGRTGKGMEACKTHTASISSDYSIYRGVLRQVNVEIVETLEDLFNLSKIYENFDELGKRVCVVTNAGGLGVLASDACDKYGLEVVELPGEVRKELNKCLPPHWSKSNPIDVIGDADARRFERVFDTLAKYNFFDVLLCLLTPQAMTQPIETAKALIKFKERTGKPCFTCFLGGEKVREAIKLLEENCIINFEEPEDFARLFQWK